MSWKVVSQRTLRFSLQIVFAHNLLTFFTFTDLEIAWLNFLIFGLWIYKKNRISLLIFLRLLRSYPVILKAVVLHIACWPSKSIGTVMLKGACIQRYMNKACFFFTRDVWSYTATFVAFVKHFSNVIRGGLMLVSTLWVAVSSWSYFTENLFL